MCWSLKIFNMQKRFCLVTITMVLVCEVSALYAESSRGFNPPPKNSETEIDELAEELFELLEGDIRVPKPVVDEPEMDLPDESFELFEGDIRIPKSAHRHKRNAVANKGLLWTDGVVPYTISSRFSGKLKAMFRSAMTMIEDATEVDGKKCIQFMPRTQQADYVQLEMYKDCTSEMGMQHKGKQIVSLGKQCYSKGTVVHELLHTLGLFHEQSRTDRDYYIDVHYENVRQGTEINFEKYPHTRLDSLNLPYDYDSIMHYESDSFSKEPSCPTITPKIKLANGVKLGQRDHLSAIDIQMIQKLYGCKSNEASTVANGICKDKLENCYMYGEHACTALPNWSAENCARTCNICTPDCKDRRSDCYSFGKQACQGQYRGWAEYNCAKYCGLGDCAVTTTPEPRQDETVTALTISSCTDKMDCSTFPKSTCSLALSLMKENCPRHCSFCKDETKMTTPKLAKKTRTALQKVTKNCADKEDCRAYASTVCTDHPDWSKQNCQLFCGICTPEATTLPTTTTQKPSCSDTISDCHSYSSAVCDNYPDWSSINCPMYCGICGSEATTTPTTTTTTTTQSPSCSDAISDCNHYSPDVCKTHPAWTTVNCQKYCGFCETPKEITKRCVDKIDDCSAYAADVCTAYAVWSKDNCPSHCGLCD